MLRQQPFVLRSRFGCNKTFRRESQFSHEIQPHTSMISACVFLFSSASPRTPSSLLSFPYADAQGTPVRLLRQTAQIFRENLIMWQSPGWKDGAEQCGSVPSNPRRFSGELSVRPRRPVPNARRTAPQIDIWRRDAPGIRHGPSC